MEPRPPLSRFVSNLAQRLLSNPYFNFVFGIAMHYNAFLAVLFLRIVLYGPQNLASFKKFPCTDGLGSTGTVRDQPYCSTSDSMWKIWMTKSLKKHNLKLNIALRESSAVLATSFNFRRWTRKLNWLPISDKPKRCQCQYFPCRCIPGKSKDHK